MAGLAGAAWGVQCFSPVECTESPRVVETKKDRDRRPGGFRWAFLWRVKVYEQKVERCRKR